MSTLEAVLHAIHVLAAGIWLGGLVFTAAVVSPAFKQMEWTPAQRIAVRSAVGRQYSKVARVNLLVLLGAAIFDWSARGLSTLTVVELVLIALVILLAELHAQFYAPRLAQAARDGAAALRGRLLRISVSVSMLNLLLSSVVVVLAAWRTT